MKKIEREVQMREGAAKLLVACSRVDQALEASKSLLTSNTRRLALLSHLQQMKKEEMRRNWTGNSSKGSKPLSSKEVVCLLSATRGQISSFFSPTPTSLNRLFPAGPLKDEHPVWGQLQFQVSRCTNKWNLNKLILVLYVTLVISTDL